MRILVTGAFGQLGRCFRDKVEQFNSKIVAAGCPALTVVYTDKEDLDITQKINIEHYFRSHEHFDYCLNCAAYTNVNAAELPENRNSVDKLNIDAPAYLASVCNSYNTKFIHISTDYVFGNAFPAVKTEESFENPLNYYGQTKYEGENKVLMEFKKGLQGLVVRTSWLYSEYGNNFVKTIMKKLETNIIKVVFDQIGTPTYAGDLAYSLLMIIADDTVNAANTGLYQFSNEGVASWYDVAEAIVEFADMENYTFLVPVSTSPEEKVKRPQCAVLNKNKFKQEFHTITPYWRTSLKKVVNKLLDEKFIDREKIINDIHYDATN